MILRKLPTFCILVLILTLWTDSVVQSQNIYPRLSLIEQFTSATSAPCVDAIPVMARVAQLRNNAVSIRYHLDFPDPGDPWNISNPVESEARRAFYDVTAIPAARVNGGAEVDPRDEQELQTQLSTDRREMSPVYITVVQDGGTIKVRVWSSIALNAHRLHVAIVSQLTRIPELSGLPGSNGQTSFSDSMLDLLTESNGLSITIPANGNQEFEFPIQLGNGQLWPDNQQYAIAFVQANSNQEVIQAGTMRNSTDTTQIAFIRPSSVTATLIGSIYGTVVRGGTLDKQIRLTNSSDADVRVRLRYSNPNLLRNDGWSVTFVPEGSITVPANGSVVVTARVGAPMNRSVFTVFNMAYSADDGAGRTVQHFDVLVDGARLAVYFGTSDGGLVFTKAESIANTPSIASDAVILPFAEVILEAFPWRNFEGVVLSIDEAGRGALGDLGMVRLIDTMLNEGKKVWLTSELEGFMNFSTDTRQFWNEDVRRWFSSKLGITHGGILGFITPNDELVQFRANGIAGSVIGDGIVVEGHSEFNPTIGNFQQFMDVWTINPGSTSRAQFTIPVNTQQGTFDGVVALTHETDRGGKLYFTSLSMLPMPSADRAAVTTNVINWMFQAPQPAVGLSAQQINFGELFVNANRTNNLTITNTGAGPLQISSVTISGADASSFEITEGAIAGSPVTVEPNATYRIGVRFAPTTSGTKNASLVINHNASGNSNVVPMSGRATVSSVETDVTSETGAISMALRGSHPVTTQSAIELTVLNGQPVTVTIVDQTGRTVSTLAQDVTASGVLTLDAAQLAAGSYTVVATNGTERAILTVVVTR